MLAMKKPKPRDDRAERPPPTSFRSDNWDLLDALDEYRLPLRHSRNTAMLALLEEILRSKGLLPRKKQ